ncbi:homoserine O-acetyltransferase [Pseudothauera nasutitermitis]|uniref:Homoserine O-acetyltransferase n=2 Tax=Pseudothauera nasutitermitis TaxID=2565930 RepID=A0A4S4B4L3_9RHOO|nr:homoserine O-acetyltransferase [Pseudothauera nasutitermitis]
MTGFQLSRETRRLVLDQPFLLESGASLPRLEIAWRGWGRLAPGGDNAVLVCHALTGSADADAWWAPFFGAGRVLDPQRDFIVCSNVLGGCYGSSGPASIAPDGRRWGGRFPTLTIRDQVRAQIALADALGIRRIQLVLGGSMGGLQALEWALLDPARVHTVATLAASGRHSAWCAVWSEAQRQALAADPKYRDGHYDPADPPRAGLAAARTVAMVSYRSAASLGERFGRSTGAEAFGERAHSPDELAARGWLRHHGQALVERFDAHSYRVLIDAMDTHDLGRGRGGYEQALRAIRQPVLVGSIASDTLYVPADQHELARLSPRAELLTIDSVHGHDGFLIDAADFHDALLDFRQRHERHPTASRGAQASPPPSPRETLQTRAAST